MRSRGRTSIAFFILVTICGLLGGCADMYVEPFGRPPGDIAKNIDYIVEINDDGRFLNPQTAKEALSSIEQKSAQTNTIVVLFVHGWHNNASPDSPNLGEFNKSVGDLRSRLSQDVYANSREILTGTRDVVVIGVYVAWRGRSLPSILDYATFWGRKNAAERVGSGDLRGFVTQLSNLYEQRNPQGASAQKRPFMGLASFGHSFGGQVLFKATQPIFEEALRSAGAKPDLEAQSTPKLSKDKPLNGFGDMVVLVNPAFEAAQYETIHQLSKSITYDRRQPPIFFVLSAEDDYARIFWFKLARGLDPKYASVPEDERKLWRPALGVYEPQQTHSVTQQSEI